MAVPEYIRRQLDADPPPNCDVPECAIPALIEGRIDTATVATIGINPHGTWCRYDYAPLRNWELDDLGITRLLEDKKRYFIKKKYGRYFGRLETILNNLGASYGGLWDPKCQYSVSAVSMDVVQWPTDPLWGELGRGKAGRVKQTELKRTSQDMFIDLLTEHPKIKQLLGNGKEVKETLELYGAQIQDSEPCFDFRNFKLYCGEFVGRRIIGWTASLPNSMLTKSQMTNLAKRVGELARSGCP